MAGSSRTRKSCRGRSPRYERRGAGAVVNRNARRGAARIRPRRQAHRAPVQYLAPARSVSPARWRPGRRSSPTVEDCFRKRSAANFHRLHVPETTRFGSSQLPVLLQELQPLLLRHLRASYGAEFCNRALPIRHNYSFTRLHAPQVFAQAIFQLANRNFHAAIMATSEFVRQRATELSAVSRTTNTHSALLQKKLHAWLECDEQRSVRSGRHRFAF